MIHAIGLVVLLLAEPAYAGVYKCAVAGKTVFQDRPCADAKSGGQVVLNSASVVDEFSVRILYHTRRGSYRGVYKWEKMSSFVALNRKIDHISVFKTG